MVFWRRSTLTTPSPRNATSAGSGAVGSHGGAPLRITYRRPGGAIRCASACSRSHSATQTVAALSGASARSIAVAASRRGTGSSPVNGKQCGV
jgi:hypothetical protein